MKSKKILFGLVLAFCLMGLVYGLFLSETNGLSKPSTKVSASDPANLDKVTFKEAKKYVDFDLVIPEIGEDYKEPITSVVLPPGNAVTDKDAIRDLTRIETIYESKKSKGEGIFITQTNNEIIPMDSATGEPIKADIITVDDLKVNNYNCNCDQNVKTYWWHNEDGVSTEIRVYGKVNEQKVLSLIKKINKKDI